MVGTKKTTIYKWFIRLITCTFAFNIYKNIIYLFIFMKIKTKKDKYYLSAQIMLLVVFMYKLHYHSIQII